MLRRASRASPSLVRLCGPSCPHTRLSSTTACARWTRTAASATRRFARSISLPPSFTVFPNPPARATTLTGARPGTAITLFDAIGRQVTAATADEAGAAALLLPQGLASGVYVVRVGSKALRLVVE